MILNCCDFVNVSTLSGNNIIELGEGGLTQISVVTELIRDFRRNKIEFVDL